MSSSDAGGRSPGSEPSADELRDPTLQAEADEAAAIARDDTGADARPEPAGRPPTEELKTAGTDEDVAASPEGPPAGTRPPDEEPRTAGTDEDVPTAEGAAAQVDQAGGPARGEAGSTAAASEQPPVTEAPVTADPLPETPEQVPTPAPQPEAAAPAAAAPAEEAPAEAEEPAGPVDEVREAMAGVLRDTLGDGVLEVDVEPGKDLWVRVAPHAWTEAARACRDRLAMDYFCFISAIDWMPAPASGGDAQAEAEAGEPAGGDGRVAAPVLAHGRAGGTTRIQALARLYSTTRHLGVFLKCDVDDEDPRLPTWVPVYAGANWHERETWEMFGIDIAGHPNLVHIYLPGEFEGFPLRKDFPLLAREVKPWPGIVDVEPMPGESDEGAEGGDT